MVFVYMLHDLSNALRLIRFTDQEKVKLEQFKKKNHSINEQNQKQSKAK